MVEQLADHIAANASRPEGLYPPESVSNAAVLRDLPGRRKSLTTGDTIALDPQPAHPEQVEAGRGARVLPPHGALLEKWSSRELERQINGALFERVVLSPAKVSPPLTTIAPRRRQPSSRTATSSSSSTFRRGTPKPTCTRSGRAAQEVPDRARPRLLLRRQSLPGPGRRARLSNSTCSSSTGHSTAWSPSNSRSSSSSRSTWASSSSTWKPSTAT